MKLKEHIENFEKSLLKEQSSAAVAGGSHYGRGGKQGMEVDDIWAGGFVATDSLKGDLTRQLTSRQQKRKEMEDRLGKDNVGIDNPLGGYFEVETEELLDTYDHFVEIGLLKKDYNKKVTPVDDPRWKNVNDDWKETLKNHFDDIKKYRKEAKKTVEKFKTTSDKMQHVDLDIKYDKIIDDYEAKKKFINDTDDWKSIYDDKKY